MLIEKSGCLHQEVTTGLDHGWNLEMSDDFKSKHGSVITGEESTREDCGEMGESPQETEILCSVSSQVFYIYSYSYD